MPRGFTENEKILIKTSLLEKGRALFTRYGLKKTSVDEIANAAGISKGAFYLFYNSKEEFFFEILEELENEMRKGFDIDKLIRSKSKREYLRDYLRYSFTYFEEREILIFFTTEDMEALLRKLPPEKMEHHIKNDNEFTFKIINALKENANMRECDENAVIGLFKSLFFIFLHKEEIGKENFNKTVELYIDMIVTYLIIE